MSDKIPACFDNLKQFQEYKSTGGVRHVTAKHHCQDCTPAYQRKMVEDKRCEHPETLFVKRKYLGDIDVVGVREGEGGYKRELVKSRILSLFNRDHRERNASEIAKEISESKGLVVRHLMTLVEDNVLKVKTRKTMYGAAKLYSLL